MLGKTAIRSYLSDKKMIFGISGSFTMMEAVGPANGELITFGKSNLIYFLIEET